MNKIVVVGGGWAGCAAAIAARKQGDEVVLVEKTDLLLGAGNAGGIMRNNGRFTATEENIAMGAKELFAITDELAVHKDVDFPGHDHASFYDASVVEPAVRKLLLEKGIKLMMMHRAVDVKVSEPDTAAANSMGSKKMTAVKVVSGGPGLEMKSQWIEANGFVEATGSSGPMGNCMAYGHGCAMCVQRCPTFGPRVSLTARAGRYDMMGLRESGKPGAFSGSCKLEKRSLSKKLQKKLAKDGFLVIPLPPDMINRSKLKEKVCQQYALEDFAENVIVIDTGEAKLMTPFFELEKLRQIEGFEEVRFLDPLGGSQGNSVRYMSVGEREANMQAKGISNLFLGGEKSGLFIGHTEAISTGSLAGYNASRAAAGLETLRLPKTLAIGELLDYGLEMLKEEDGLYHRFTFAGGEFLERMKERGLYRTSVREIRKIVEAEGLLGVYNRGRDVVE